MKSTLKRSLSLLLALTLLCTALPGLALPARALTYSGECGDELSWSLDYYGGALTITGSGDMEDYFTYMDVPWYRYSEEICTVSLPEGLTSISDYAFCDCVSMGYAEIPGSVTRIGRDAFRGTSVFDVYVKSPDCEIYDDTYTLGTPGRTTIHGYKGSTAERYALYNSYSFVSFGDDFSGTCGAFGDNLIWVFDRDTGVLRITGSDDMLDFEDPASAPWQHHSNYITAAVLSAGVTSIGDFAFISCSNLSSVAIPDSVTRIGSYAFAWCDALGSVTIPDSVTCIDWDAFEGCSSLRSVTIPDSVRTIGGSAFTDCSSLDSVAVYNPSCAIERDRLTLGDPSHTVLYGDVDSTVHQYAKQYGYVFRPLTSFSDVDPDAWYAIPAAWAVQNGISAGTGSGSFSPDRACTREQAAAFLWRANGAPAPDGTDNPFGDVPADRYYYDPVLWAYYHEPQITSGVDETSFGVGEGCTRAQVVTFLWNAAGKPEPAAAENPFADVEETDYFYKAVLWAVENGVTAGTAPTSFSPDKTCTRGQVATFLYKLYGD